MVSTTRNETTPLISDEKGSLHKVENGGSGPEAPLQAKEEPPWPATFERAMSLLASPTIGTPKDVDLMTRSPLRSVNVTPLLKEARRKMQKDYHELLESPKIPKAFRRQQSMDADDLRDSAMTGSFDEEAVNRVDKKLQLAGKDAHAYRMKILQQQKQTGIKTKVGSAQASALDSPGMQKEKFTDKIRKQQKQEIDQGHGGPGQDAAASFSQCVFNLANILMGVGLLGLPYVCKSAGWIEGTAVLCLFAVICWRTAILIGRCLNGDPRPAHEFRPTSSTASGKMMYSSPYKSPVPPGIKGNPQSRLLPPMSSYPEMARKAFGKTGGIVLSSILYFELFSCLAIFIVSMGEHMHELIPSIEASTHDIILTALLVIPTILLTTPKLLSYLSAVGTVSTILVVLAVFVNAFVMGDISEEFTQIREEREGKTAQEVDSSNVHHEAFNLKGMPIALGLVAFCFSGHAVVPSIYTSMANPHNFESMVNVSFTIVLVACVSVGLSGYYTFGNAVYDQVTLSLAAEPRFGTSHIITILTWLMVITAFSKCTLTLFPLALGIEEIVAPLFEADQEPNVSNVKDSIFKKIWIAVKEFTASLGIRVALLFLAVLVALYVPSFSFLCSLVGLICTMAVSVIFPAAVHLCLFRKTLTKIEIAVDCFFIFFGTISAIVGTIATVSQY